MSFQSTQQQIFMRKIWRRKEEIKDYMISNITPITEIKVRETSDFEQYEDAVKAKDYRNISVGDKWGHGNNAWFKINFTIPKNWKGKEVAAFIDIGGEGCAFIDGKPYQGVDINHQEILLATSAKGGESFEIVIDANSIIWHSPHDHSPKTLKRAELATRNPEVQEYWFNLDILHQLAEVLPEDSPRKAKIIYTLNKSVDLFDYTNIDEESLKKSAIAANKVLQPLLNCKSEPSATNIAVHGHSHIDVAWLWPYAETKRKVSRTFSTVMRMMEQYPDYLFSQSQAQLYQFCKEKYPTIYDQIKKRVKEGRWDVTGSMWVEADCNLCSGESLIRQIVVGKNFYKDEFGIETDVLWLPDLCGYSAALPQILQKARVPYFSTIKINWSQLNHFPYSTFHWKGIDGTSVLAHFPPTTDYNAFPSPKTLKYQVEMFKEKDRSDWSLLSYGWGDGGGSADRRHLELLKRSKDLEGLPRCKHMKVTDFFHTIDGAAEYPEWVGELYFELHRGTYTTQAKNKWYNRKSELLYRDAEILSSIASPMGLEYPLDELAKQWKDILLNQFHDVIPGSSIHWVYEDTDKMYPKIIEFGECTVKTALSKIIEGIDTTGDGDAIVIFNSLPWNRKDIASIKPKSKSDYAILDPNGNEIASQIVGDSIRFIAEAPSMGYTVYRLVKRTPKIAKNDIKITKTKVENKFYTIELDRNGTIKSLTLKSNGRELLPEGARGNMIQLYEDKPNDYDAWDIDMFYDDKVENITDVQSFEVVEHGPIQAAILIERKFGKSLLRQKMIVYSDNPRIDFETWVDWHEDHKCLKASFPVDVNATKARYEIQFGNIERPTHKNTSWDRAKFEVCAHKWADISEEGFGMSLLNDCKYGYHTKGNEMRITLLRAPKDPDPIADMGEHIFTYSIMPHEGDYIDAGTVRQGYELNVPMHAVVVKGTKGDMAKEMSFFTVSADNVILETVKRAEKEDATLLRFYECHNIRANVNVSAQIPFDKVYECDLMEDNIAEIKHTNNTFSFDIKPFEIKTFKLKKI